MALFFNRDSEGPRENALPTGMLPNPSTGITNQFLPQSPQQPPNPFLDPGGSLFGIPFSRVNRRGQTFGEKLGTRISDEGIRRFGGIPGAIPSGHAPQFQPQATPKRLVKKRPLAANAASRFRNLFIPGSGGPMQNPFLRF